MRSTSHGRRRRWWWLAALAAVGVAAAFGTTVLSARGGTSPRNPCDVAGAKRTGVTGTVTPPSAGHGLRVVEKGFTQLDDPVGTVSLGAMVENRSELVAYHTRVRFLVLDGQQRSAVPANSGELLEQEIPVILPGERVGVGAWTYLRETSSSQPVTVDRFDIDLDASQWWPRDNDVHTFRPISTRHLETQRSSVEDTTGTVRYSVDSAFCGALTTRGVATVFRNSDGALVGGSFARDNSKDRCRPGRYTESTDAFRSIPPGIDDSRTESYPYCGPGPTGGNPTATEEPVN